MTTLNLTITPERAVLSQDHGLYEYAQGELATAETAPTEDAEAAVTQTFTGNGERPEPSNLCEVEKIVLCHERRMLIGMAGAYNHAKLWPIHLAIHLPAGDVTDIAEQVPERLRRLVESVPASIPELLIVHAGWSASEGRVVGYAYERSNDFKPVRLDRGHTLAPIVNPEAPDYAQLTRLWTEALEGRQVEDFHAALFQNQRWSYEQGRLRPGVHLSRSYSIAAVDAGGARFLSRLERVR